MIKKYSIKVVFAFCCTILWFCSIGLKAQDVAFSQSYASHLNLNPALAGLSYTPTIAINYRNQWAGFSGGYKTYSISVDQHFDSFNSGLGLQISNDKTLLGAVGHFQISGLYSYFIPINGEWGSTIGLQATMHQRKIDYNSLVFGDQIDELTGVQPTGVQTGEDLNFENRKYYFGLSSGFMLFSSTFYVGASFKNINKPNISVAKIDEENIGEQSKLPLYVSLHAGNTFYLNNVSDRQTYVAPNVFYANQGQFHQVLAGAQAGIDILFGGIWARHNITNFDALIFLLGIEKGIVRAGYSYDLSVGQPGRFAGQTHELSFVITPLENKTESKQRNIRRGLMCPRVL